MCLFYKPSVRFHRMRIICLWCLIQHLFQRDARTTRMRSCTHNVHYRFWWFSATLNANCLKMWIPKWQKQLLHIDTNADDAHVYSWCSSISQLFQDPTSYSKSRFLTVIFRYARATTEEKNREKIWSSVNTDIQWIVLARRKCEHEKKIRACACAIE